MITTFKVKAGQVALVMKNGNIIDVKEEGRHLVLNASVQVFDKTVAFVPPVQLNIALRNQQLASLLEVVEVKDNEIVLLFVNGNFRDVLTPGRFAFWKGVMEYSFIRADLSSVEIGEEITKTMLELPKVKAYVRKFSVASEETGLLYLDGKFVKSLKSGVYSFWANSTSVEIKNVDLRQRMLEISGQELLTKDKAALRINFFVQFRVIDALMAVSASKEYEKQLYLLMQLALRDSIGTLTLDELLGRKEALGQEILELGQLKASALGIRIEYAGIRDIILPGDMKDIMNQVLVAEKKAQANTIMRREETASTRSLLNTARLMEENEMLFKLKEMEYVEKIAEKINTISVSGSGQIVDQLKQIFSK